MLKLFRSIHGHIFQTPKFQFKIPNLLVPNSHLYNSCETLAPDWDQGFVLNEVEEFPSAQSLEQRDSFTRESGENFDQSASMMTRKVQVSHPWPEWVKLMEQLLRNGYFEDVGNPFRKGELDAKDVNRIRTACLNFARERIYLIRYFSTNDIQVIAGSGCPVIDRKVVNSGKRLRAHVGIDERNVCSSCTLRGNCERAYVKARNDEDGRTVDVMRLLLTYGLHPLSGMVENKLCLNKLVKGSVRRLLNQMVGHGMKELNSDLPIGTFTKSNPALQESSTHQGKGHITVSIKRGDWICSKCNRVNFTPNAKCLHCDGPFQERFIRKEREGQDHFALKKGDWICDKCNFLNFAKNTRCLQCNEKPPSRQLNPGEWECDSCNYINFRRNTVCIKCGHKRPKVSYSLDTKRSTST